MIGRQVCSLCLTLYKAGAIRPNELMNFSQPMLWSVVGVLALLLIGGMVAASFSSGARLERRRRKSNTRVISKANRPMVKFSARPPHAKD